MTNTKNLFAEDPKLVKRFYNEWKDTSERGSFWKIIPWNCWKISSILGILIDLLDYCHQLNSYGNFLFGITMFWLKDYCNWAKPRRNNCNCSNIINYLIIHLIQEKKIRVAVRINLGILPINKDKERSMDPAKE